MAAAAGTTDHMMETAKVIVAWEAEAEVAEDIAEFEAANSFVEKTM